MSQSVAQALLDIDALRIQPEAPITFKSGIVSPVYLDNRKLIAYPEQWHIVINAFAEYLATSNTVYDAIAGVATAGIPHSAALAFRLKTPSLYVRKESKEHGTGQLLEGAAVQGNTVVLVEDMVTTGGSSLKAVQAITDAGGKVSHCLCITTYGFATETFNKAGIELVPLVAFPTLLAQAVENTLISSEEQRIILDWYNDPQAWAKRHGFNQ